MPPTSPVRFLPRATLGISFALAVSAAPRAARAQELAPPTAAMSAPGNGAGSTSAPTPATSFGVSGELVLTVQSHSDGNATSSFSLVKQASGNTSVTVQPALDYFIINGVSVGGVVGYNYSGGSTPVTTIDVGARAGFNQGISEHFGLWPTLGVDVAHQTVNKASTTTEHLEVYAPFLCHLVPHFLLGVGPFLGYQLDGKDTEYGLDFVIGGWL
jgi:hypothetical protein